MFVQKRKLKQAPALTKDMVIALEKAACTLDHPHERVVAGHLCFTLFCSARFSDAVYLDDLSLKVSGDVYLVEASTAKHKTSTTKEKQCTLLPFIAIGKGLYQDSWADSWFKSREVTQLDCFSQITTPAVLSSDQWDNRRLTTGEATLALRDILVQSGFDSQTVEKYSTHSLKATLLNWASLYGLPVEDRRILGHHFDGTSKSVVTYSRDALIAVHLRVQNMLNKILDGSFDPDLDRVERLRVFIEKRPRTSDLSSNSKARHDLEHTDSDDSEPASVASDIPHVEDAEKEAVALWDRLNPGNKLPSNQDHDLSDALQHTKSGIIHYPDHHLEGMLLCSRFISAYYRKPINKDPIDRNICTQCASRRSCLA